MSKRIECEVCGKGPTEGVTVHRVNPKGEPGVWRCESDLTPTQVAQLDPETVRIVRIIEGKEVK